VCTRISAAVSGTVKKVFLALSCSKSVCIPG
jgi:hypothetical protein